MKKTLYKKMMALSLLVIPLTISGGCGKENAESENSSIFESISSAEADGLQGSEMENADVTEVQDEASSTEELSDSTKGNTATAETQSENEETAVSTRKDRERFEETIMLEGMEETVKYEHAISDTLGFEIDYDYESLIRESDSTSERFISIYDDQEKPENFLEITYTSDSSDKTVESISEMLSNEFDDIGKDTYTLDNAGSCIRIDASMPKSGSFELQTIYVIPAGDGSLVATAHYTFESAEGFGNRFSYIVNTLVVIPRDDR